MKESHMLSKLARKFWDGTCSDQEEEQLKMRLQEGPVPAELEELAAYFSFLRNEKIGKNLDESFDNEMLNMLEANALPEIKREVRFPYFSRIAASLVLIFGLGFGIYSINSSRQQVEITDEFVDTFQDSEEAYREVKKALMMVSSEMNNGMQHTEMLGEFHKTKTQVERTN